MVKAKAKAKGKARANAKGNAKATAKPNAGALAEEAALQRRMERHRFEAKRYGELFEHTRRLVAQRIGTALEVDENDCVYSDLAAAKQFADWWRASAPTYFEVESLELDSRLICIRLDAWSRACLRRFPDIVTMYAAEENSRDRAYLQAGGVTFEPSPAAPMPMPEYSNASNTTHQRHP